MKYSDEFENEEEKKGTSKGFYVALAVCLVAICGVAVTTFVGTLPTDEPETTDTTKKSTTATTSVQQVVIPATDIKDDRTTTTAPTTTTTATEKADDLFVFPVSNRVLRSFSKNHYFSETLGEWVTHNGVDFEASEGDAVKAAADGKITAIRQDALWGDVIEITHEGNLITRYCGVTADAIAEGQSVQAGDTIGKLSAVPAEVLDGAHLHMELVVNGTYTDPLTLIKGQTVTVTTAPATTTAKK